MGGVRRSHRDGLYRCKPCRGQFTVTVGTMFERSKVSLPMWLRAAHMFSANSVTASVTPRDVERELSVTYKTAWSMVQAMLRTAAAYKGPNVGFGRKIVAHIRSKRPAPPKHRSAETYRAWKKKTLAGWHSAPIESTGVLASFDAGGIQSKDIDRTERLMRMLMSGPKILTK
jgi:transposase-like protein